MKTKWRNFFKNFSKAPAELKVFISFSFAITVIGLFIDFFSPKSFKESIIPITGWLICMPYLATLLGTVSQLSQSKKLSKIRRSRYSNILFMTFFIIINAVELLFLKGNDYGNPYLMISPIRPYWTIALPAFWILVLLSPRIKKFYDFLDGSFPTTYSTGV